MIQKEHIEFLINHLAKTQSSRQAMLEDWDSISDWEVFGWMFKCSIEQPWFDDLLYNYWSCPRPNKVFPYHFIDPERFANALYDFLSGKFPSPYLKNKEKGKYD